MGGLRQPPASAERVSEKVVYVDSPEVRKKYHDLANALRESHKVEVNLLRHELDLAKKEKVEIKESPELLDRLNRALKENGELKNKIKRFEDVSAPTQKIVEVVEKIIEVEKPVESHTEKIKHILDKRLAAAIGIMSFLSGLGIGSLF